MRTLSCSHLVKGIITLVVVTSIFLIVSSREADAQICGTWSCSNCIIINCEYDSDNGYCYNGPTGPSGLYQCIENPNCKTPPIDNIEMCNGYMTYTECMSEDRDRSGVRDCAILEPTPTPTPKPGGGGPTPTPTPTPTPLPCPAGTSATCTSPTNVTLDWADIANAYDYVVRINKSPYGDWVGPGDLFEYAPTSLYTTAISSGVYYKWDVQGRYLNEPYPWSGCRGPFAQFICMDAPNLTSVTPGCPPQNTLSWTSVPGATSYDVQRCSGSGCTPSAFGSATSDSTTTSFVDTGLTSGTLYRYRVRAYNSVTGMYGPFSGIVRGTPSCPSPTPPPTSPPCSCTGNLLPSSASSDVGDTTTFSMGISNITSGCSVRRVDFASSNTSVATVSPTSDSAPPYTTTATALRSGSTTISGQVIMSDGRVGCSDFSSLSVSAPPTPTPTPSCSVTLNLNPGRVSIGQTSTATANVTTVGGSVSKVVFSVTAGGASVSPVSDSTSAYQTVVTPSSVGSATIRAGVIMGEIEMCANTATLSIDKPVCSINLLPSSYTLGFGQTGGFGAFITSGSADKVTFSSSNTSVATVSPTSDSSSPFATTATTDSIPGTTTITARGYLLGYECGYDTSTITVLAPSCTLSLSPASAEVELGASRNFYATVGVTPQPPYSPSDVDSVNFSISDANIATVCNTASTPCPDGASLFVDSNPSNPAGGYQAAVTGKKVGGPVTLRADGVMFGTSYCSDTSQVTVINPPAWWQVKEGDAVAATGNISTDIPFGCSLPVCQPYFIINDSGDDPGIPSFTGSLFLGTDLGGVSSKGWQAQSPYLDASSYTYEYFESKLPVAVAGFGSSSIPGSTFNSGGTDYKGYSIYRYTGGGELTINSDVSIAANRRVILFAPGGVNISGKINVVDGTSFFMIISGGDIEVLPSIGGGAGPHLEGLYFAEGSFTTLSAGDDSDIPLRIRGSIAAMTPSGVDFNRDLNPSLPENNSNTPAEFVEFAPDQVLMYPEFLGIKPVRWREVAP